LPHITHFANAKIWQPAGSSIGSFAIKDNLIFSVSDKNDSGSAAGNTDLNGKLVLPGFTDGHVHLVYGSLMRKRIDCSSVATFDELNEKITRYMRANPDKMWLVGGNLNIEKIIDDIRSKTDVNIITLFDKIVSNKALFIANYDYHSGLCNSLALQLSQVLQKLDLYSNDEIPRDRNGKPVGLVREKAKDFIFYNIPQPAQKEIISAVEEMMGVLHCYGITSVCDITRSEDFEIYVKLFELGKLKVRVNSYIPLSEYQNHRKYIELTSVIPEELFTIKGFKSYYDGALGSETALFKSNYKGKQYNGYKTEIAESGTLLRLAGEIDKAGKQIMVHAIGDKAVSEVLDICETLTEENGKRDRRFRIEHAQHIDENDFDRFKDLGIIASVQPIHLKYDAKIVIGKLPEVTVARTHNYVHLINRGVSVNFGTDFPIVDINPYENIRMAAAREIDGSAFYPDNKIPVHQCMKSYTVNGAYSCFNETRTGTIEKGKYADFIIMDSDILKMPESEIGGAKVWKTYINGEEVYSAD
jgi:hypothetical protein